MSRKGFAPIEMLVVAMILGAVLLGGVYLYSRNHAQTQTPIAQPTRTPTSTPVAVAPQPPEEIPIKVQEITPEAIVETSSVTSTILGGDFTSIYALGTIQANKTNIDPKQAITQLDKDQVPVTVLPSIDGGIHYPYIMSSGDGGDCGSAMDYSCQNPVLKVFDPHTNTIMALTGSGFLPRWMGPIVYLANDDALLAMGSHKYAGKFVLYNPTGKYAFKSTNTSSSYALLFGNFLTSFDSTTNKLSVEDLVGHAFNQCTVSDPNYQSFFAKNFTNAHVAVDPDGNRIAIFADKLVWADIPPSWGNRSSSNCMDSFKVLPLQNLPDIGGYDRGQWFNNGRIFAVTAPTMNSFLYDFDRQYQAPAMLWSEGMGVGVNANSGYADTTDLGYKGFSIKTERGRTNVNVYLMDSSGKRSLIKNYQTQMRGIYGDRPTIWFRVFKDKSQKGLFHLLALDGYTFRQFVDVVIEPAASGATSTPSGPSPISPAAATSTYPVTWQGGNLSFAITSADEAPTGGICDPGPCPNFNAIFLNLKITTDGTSSYSASSIPLHVSEVDGSGNLTGPALSSINQLMPATTTDVQLEFHSPTRDGMFETGGSPNIFFLFKFLPFPSSVATSTCPFPATSTLCLGEMQQAAP